MPNESTPPIRELPDEIETAITWLAELKLPYTTRLNAEKSLRQTIRAALTDQDAALRERCERLRQTVLYMTGPPDGRVFVPEKYFQPGDLADNLRPRGGDER